ncbi:MAG TPA: DUF4921 family protein [bacterium]|nr:DUF4921 family protein [bacterium]
MSELRQDPITGTWVAIAYERAAREGALVHPEPPGGGAAPGHCPFCPGAEHETPPERERLRLPDDAEPWRVRVVQNRFPAFGSAAPPAGAGDPPFAHRSGRGDHEVVIETPRHGQPFEAFAPDHAALVLQAWQRRHRTLAALEGVEAVVTFKNSGGQAGASLAHAHSQMVAMGMVPPRLALKQARAREHAERTGASLYAAMLAAERAAGTRIVREWPGLVALSPYAARWPYETWLVPTEPTEPFEALPPERLEPVARACQALLRGIGQALGPCDYNLLLCTPPLHEAPYLPWHVELVPRAIQPGGFELSTDLPINPIPPERCAERLREALREQDAAPDA